MSSTDIIPAKATGDIVLAAIVHARKMADEKVLNGLSGRQVSSVSDVHIAKNEPVTVRVNGELESFEPTRNITESEISEFLRSHLEIDLSGGAKNDPFGRAADSPRGMSKGANTWTIDKEETGPLRVHVTKTDNGYALAIRLLPVAPPELGALGLPKFVNRLPSRRKGLTIVAGATGSGKTTALAAILERINQTYPRMIVDISEAIEYRYKPNKSRFRQIEIGMPGQAPSYHQALVDLLQADPDIVVVAEARTPDAIEAAIQIAQRGRWCILTMHLDSADQVADMIVGAFPDGAQNSIRTSLASVLQDVILMALPRTKDGRGRVPACEILTRTEGMKQAILEPSEMSTAIALKNTIQSGRDQGMQLMEDALFTLVKEKGLVSYEEAMDVAIRPKDLERRLKEVGITAESSAKNHASGGGSFAKE